MFSPLYENVPELTRFVCAETLGIREIGRKICAVERGVSDGAHAYTVDGVGKQTNEQGYKDVIQKLQINQTENLLFL